MAILDQNHGLIPLEKYQCQFFDFSNFLFLKPRKGLLVLEYRKRHFPGLYCLKKKVGKMAVFGPKPRVNPFGKMSIFRLLTSCFYSVEKPFFVLEYRKRHFPNLYCLKKKIKKWPFLDQNHGLTTLEKCLFFDFLNFLFLQPKKIREILVFIAKKSVFLFQNILKDIFLAYIA